MKQYIFSVGTYNMYGEEYYYTETISANSLESALKELNIRYAFFTEWGYKLVRIIDISVSQPINKINRGENIMNLPINSNTKLSRRFISKYNRARQNYNRFSSKSRKYRKWVKACMKAYNLAIKTPNQLIP